MSIPLTENSSVTPNVESDWSFDEKWGIFGGQDKHRITVQSDGKLTLSLVHQTFSEILMEKFGGAHKETVTPVKEFEVHQLDESQKKAFSQIAKGREKTFCEFEEKALRGILISLKDKTGRINTQDLEQRITRQVQQLNDDIANISSRVLKRKPASIQEYKNPVLRDQTPASKDESSGLKDESSELGDQSSDSFFDADDRLPFSEPEQQVLEASKRSALPLEKSSDDNEQFFDAEDFDAENPEPLSHEVDSQLKAKEESIDTRQSSKPLKHRVKKEKNAKQEGRLGLLKTVAVCALLLTSGLFNARRSNTDLFNDGSQSQLDISPEALSSHKKSLAPPSFTNSLNMTGLVDPSIFERSLSGTFNETDLVEFPHTATNWSSVLSPDFDLRSFTTSLSLNTTSPLPLPTSSLNATSSPPLPDESFTSRSNATSPDPLPTSPIRAPIFPLPLPISPDPFVTLPDRLPTSQDSLSTLPDESFTSRSNATSPDPLPTSPIRAPISPLPLPISPDPFVTLPDRLPTSPLNETSPDPLPTLSDSLPASPPPTLTSPLDATSFSPVSTSTTLATAVGLAAAIATIALIRFGKNKKDVVARLSKEIDGAVEIALKKGELVERDVTDINAKKALLNPWMPEAELEYRGITLIIEINERRLNNLNQSLNLQKLDNLAMEMISLEEKLKSITQNTELLSKCEGLKKDCINAAQSAMVHIARDIAQTFDGKTSVEDMDKGKSLDVEMMKIYSAVDKKKFIEVPAQVGTDIYRQCVIVNGVRLQAKASSKESEQFQICQQVVQLLGRNGVDKFKGILHQSLPADFISSFMVKTGIVMKNIGREDLRAKIGEELFNQLDKEFPQLLDPEFFIHVKEDGSVDFNYSFICRFVSSERSGEDVENDPILGEVLYRLNFSFNITKENYQQQGPVSIDNATWTVSDLVNGFENIAQLKSPDAVRIQERREVGQKLKESYEAKFQLIKEKIETKAEYKMFKTYWDREYTKLNNLYDDHRLDGKGLEQAVNAKIKQMQDSLKIYETTVARFAKLKSRTSDTMGDDPADKYVKLMDALTQEYNDLAKVYANGRYTNEEINKQVEKKIQELEDCLKLFDQSDKFIDKIENELRKLNPSITVQKVRKEKIEKTFKPLVAQWENGPYTLSDLKKIKEGLEKLLPKA